MYFIWLAMSVMCLIYYVVCVSYASFGSAFVPMWLAAGIIFLVFFFVFRYIDINHIVVLTWIKILFFGCLAFGFGLFIILEGLIISEMSMKPKDNCEYIIVLGAKIKGTKVMKSLKERLDTAYDYSIANPNTYIIVSGGQGADEDISEAKAMKAYLVERGLDDSRITMEDKSINTDENMRFSVEYIMDKNSSVGIVSSNFHMYRAVKLAKAQGLTNVSGIPSPCNTVLFVNYMVRESVGILKDAVMGNY